MIIHLHLKKDRQKKIDNVEKLICSFKPKNNYVLHYRNLKQYLKQGMILKKVHRGIKFYQSKWMEPYIRKNTDLQHLPLKKIFLN